MLAKEEGKASQWVVVGGGEASGGSLWKGLFFFLVPFFIKCLLAFGGLMIILIQISLHNKATGTSCSQHDSQGSSADPLNCEAGENEFLKNTNSHSLEMILSHFTEETFIP